MLQTLVGILVLGAIAFIAIAAIAYVVVRFVFVRLAERISAQIAAQLEKVADDVAVRPSAVQAIQATAAVGSKLRHFAATRGLNINDAKVAFLGRLDGTARLMDRAIPLPLVGGIGLDALLGLMPFVGDAISAMVAGTIILNSLQYGIPKALVAKMVANMFIDVVFGAIPLIGDLFDIAFKANTRNVALVKAYLDDAKRLDSQTVRATAMS